MADLKETDEPVEKAGMVPKGGSARLRSKIVSGRRKAYDRLMRSDPYKYGKPRGPLRRGLAGRLGIRKSSDPLSTLYGEIEKARGLIPGGKSSKLLRSIAARAHKDPTNAKLARAYRYLAHRTVGERGKGVYKSALVDLGSVIEKARGLMPRGVLPGGGARRLQTALRRNTKVPRGAGNAATLKRARALSALRYMGVRGRRK